MERVSPWRLSYTREDIDKRMFPAIVGVVAAAIIGQKLQLAQHPHPCQTLPVPVVVNGWHFQQQTHAWSNIALLFMLVSNFNPVTSYTAYKA